MIDSTGSGAVVDERTARPAELMIQRDRRCEAEQPLQDALAEPGKGPCAVAFEREDVLAGPEDRLDPLADRCEVRASARLVLAPRSDDRGVQLTDLAGELSACVALVADHGLPACTAGAGEQLQ